MSPRLGPISLLIGLLIAAPAGAQEPAPATPTAPAPDTPQDEGLWSVSSRTDPDDGSRSVRAWISSSSGKSSTGQQIVFVATCEDDRTDAYIVWSDYLSRDNPEPYDIWKHVTVRIGDAEPERQQWRISIDDEATFAPDWGGDLLKAMARADTFIAETTPYEEDRVTALFNTRGMSAALAPLAETCGWSLD